MSDLKLGIALSGGGIRGIAHAGVLKALEDNNIKIDVIGGTSSGGLVASLYAMGYSPYYIYVLFKKYAKELIEIDSGPIVSGIGNFMLNKKVSLLGLNSGKAIEEAYNHLAQRKGIYKIEDIKQMPLIIPAVDVLNSKEYIFTNSIPKDTEDKSQYITDIPLGKAVRASSSFPAIFCPCEYKKHQFLDGGVLDNIPVTEVRKQGVQKVIAVNFKADDIDNNSNVMDIVMRTIDIMGNKIIEQDVNSSDILLNIRTDKIGLMEANKMKECFDCGYNTVQQQIKEIKRVLRVQVKLII